MGFPDGAEVKNAVQEPQETQVQGPLEKGMATHSVFLPGELYGQRGNWRAI